MSLTPSTMLPLGTRAPNFSLPDLDGNLVSRWDFVGRPLCVMFICNHCPYVKHVAPALASIARDYADKGVAFVAINSNDAEQYPDDAPDKMATEARRQGYTFPYLYDATQEVATAFTAACTPDVFLFDRSHRLFFRGQIDDTRPHRISSGNYDSSKAPATGNDLRAAIDDLLADRQPPDNQKPSAGCNIKWKPGHQPAYVTA
jgi:thiol-disulfide isomerase/thioredoxin